jgi:hypothetical protein
MKLTPYEQGVRALVITTVLVVMLVLNLNDDKAFSTLILLGCVYSMGFIIFGAIRDSRCPWLDDKTPQAKPYDWAEEENN